MYLGASCACSYWTKPINSQKIAVKALKSTTAWQCNLSSGSSGRDQFTFIHFGCYSTKPLSRYEAPRWYNLLADSASLAWAVPDEMAWSNREMMVLSAELRKLEAAAGQLRMPVTLIQGEKDSLVDPQTVGEFQKHAPAAWLSVKNLPKETHFVLWEKPELIVSAIKETPCALSP